MLALRGKHPGGRRQRTEFKALIKKHGGDVTCVLTDGGAQFVTPMSLAALSGNQVHTSLWDLKNEAEIGHIQLSRDADLVVVCPATADLGSLFYVPLFCLRACGVEHC